MSDQTPLQRKILITAYNNPDMSQAEISRQLDCSSSYVSEVLSKYDNFDAMTAEIEELNQQLGMDPMAGISETRQWNDTQPNWQSGGEFDANTEEIVQEGVQGIRVIVQAIRKLFK